MSTNNHGGNQQLIRAGGVAAGAGLALCLTLPVALAWAISLTVHLNGDQLHVKAPDLQFLSQAAQARLHDGATVTYKFRLLVSATKTGTPTAEHIYHCVFSFDILEEKYKVSRREPGYRSTSHLSESTARDLCLDSLTIPAASLANNAAFWISMEYQLEDRQASADHSDSRSVLDTLVNIFGRRSKSAEPVDMIRGGPFRMEDLRKTK